MTYWYYFFNITIYMHNDTSKPYLTSDQLYNTHSLSININGYAWMALYKAYLPDLRIN